MTTNVIDRRKLLLTTDSRWSAKLDDDTLVYVDDTGFDKMVERYSSAIICAGDGLLIEGWRNWFNRPLINWADLPPVDRFDQNGDSHTIVISVVVKPSGEILFSNGWYFVMGDHASFSGSGWEPARNCFAVNYCALTAVGSAGRVDPATGGETKFINVAARQSNLSKGAVTLSDVETLLHQRGMKMDLKTNTVTRFNPKADGSHDRISAEKINLSAPTGQPSRPWSEEEKQGLRAAMQRLAEIELASNDV